MIRITTFAGQRVAVFGLARSGIASALALADGGADVLCWDDGEGARAAAGTAGLAVVDLASADWSGLAALVLAPGVPLTHPKPHWTVEKARAAGVPVIGDIELFFRERAKSTPGSPVIAITGTNGKSTTTALVAHVLRAAGRDVQMGGNIGVGILALEPPAAGRVHVIEMSSFQIDLTPTLNPTVGILMNLSPDHLDRHGDMETYAAVKARLVAGADHPVIGIDDDWCHDICDRLRMSARGWVDMFSVKGRVSSGWYAEGAVLHSRAPWAGRFGPYATVEGIGSLRGAHNAQNALAASIAAMILELSPDDIQAGLRSFPGLAHRMEQVGRVGRALFINDSKGTNADSTEKALASFAGDVHWIVGGVMKEGGIEPLVPLFPRVAKAYLIGASSDAFARTLEGRVAYERCGTLEVAVLAAARDAGASAAAEAVVLLSPACASYDQYKSFEHRGDHFRVLVAALADVGEPARPA
jgi:UDP-N-acetylmuramoylalanine--D-glutamate ligase